MVSLIVETLHREKSLEYFITVLKLEIFCRALFTYSVWEAIREVHRARIVTPNFLFRIFFNCARIVSQSRRGSNTPQSAVVACSFRQNYRRTSAETCEIRFSWLLHVRGLLNIPTADLNMLQSFRRRILWKKWGPTGEKRNRSRCRSNISCSDTGVPKDQYLSGFRWVSES